MEFRDYVTVVRRGWAIILGVMVAVIGAVALYTFTRTPLYLSQAKAFVSLQSAANMQDLIQGNSFTQQAVQSYAEVAVTPIVLDAVIGKEALPMSSAELAERIDASAPLQSNVLTISVRDEDPNLAARLANDVSARLSDVAGELTTTESGQSPVKITLIEPAIAARYPVSPRKSLNLAVGALAGLALGIAVAAVLRGGHDGARRNKRSDQRPVA